MTNILPWQTARIVGSANLTFTLDVSTEHVPNVFIVRKQRSTEPDPGFWVGYHNDVRISDKRHEHATQAKAETEAYFYTLPEFKRSGNALALDAVKLIGAADHDAGVSIQKGFTAYDGAARENWFAGWLEAYAKKALAKLSSGIDATTRANNQLEGDLAYFQRVNQALQMVFTFATTQLTTGDDTRKFIIDFLHNEADAKWPAWLEYRKRPINV